jgi:uncharacterized protein (TIGR02598 family)
LKTKTLSIGYSKIKADSLGTKVAFSLVEVVIAIAVFSFCLLTLLALVPVGLTDNKSSRDRMIVSDLCSSLESDMKATATTNFASPINGITFPTPSATATSTATTTLYDIYTSSSTTTFSMTKGPASQYRFTIVLTSYPTNSYPFIPVLANVHVTWPASASPTVATGSTTAAVAINRF